MNQATWADTARFVPDGRWQRYLRADAPPAVLCNERVTRIKSSHRGTQSNWWTLGVSLGFFVMSSAAQHAIAAPTDCLKIAASLVRARQRSDATMLATDSAGHYLRLPVQVPSPN